MADIWTRSTPFTTCSSETTAPGTGFVVVLSITRPVSEFWFSATSPAWSVGFRRYRPLPCRRMERQASKSMLMSADCPAIRLMAPPAICPGGILSPVCASLLKLSVWGDPPFGTTQLKPPDPQALGEGVAPVASLARRIKRICWYFPGGRPVVEPNVLRVHAVDARLSKSICIGPLVRSTRVTQPLSFEPASELMWATTLVTVTQTLEY